MTNTIIPPNRLKRAIHAGQHVVGTMLAEIRQPSVMQLLANAEFDFVIIDNEHGGFNVETLADLSRAAQYVGLTPIVRVPDLSYAHIAQTLDVGAQGIMIPRITSAQQVRDVVDMMKYPPMGIRGNASSRGYTNFKSGPVEDIMLTANEETILIVQIETREALDELEEIVNTPGVYAILVGPNDLSISLGIPGQYNSMMMQAAIHKVITVCQKHGVCPGIHMNNLDLATYWVKKGMQLISSGSEIGFLTKGGLDLTSTIRKTIEREFTPNGS
ncbi:aldolase/citrate lyase family protein [Anaerolineales bacterium HSG6]|nr:aldolase/citrate lyase family protein [Anaerolineales bacterium HSG6]MDM8532561.1 aldolase/citrate lyase family protein [Anaerolineales bacterium HSG25]